MNKLKAIRLERGLTMKQLAELVGVTESAISRYESGERSLSPAMAMKIAPHLGLDSWKELFE